MDPLLINQSPYHNLEGIFEDSSMKQICAVFLLVYLLAPCVEAAEQAEQIQVQTDLSTIQVLDLEMAQ